MMILSIMPIVFATTLIEPEHIQSCDSSADAQQLANSINADKLAYIKAPDDLGSQDALAYKQMFIAVASNNNVTAVLTKQAQDVIKDGITDAVTDSESLISASSVTASFDTKYVVPGLYYQVVGGTNLNDITVEGPASFVSNTNGLNALAFSKPVSLMNADTAFFKLKASVRNPDELYTCFIVTAENDLSDLAKITEANIKGIARCSYRDSRPATLDIALAGKESVLAIYVLKTENVTGVECGSGLLSLFKSDKYSLEHYDCFLIYDDSGLFVSKNSKIGYGVDVKDPIDPTANYICYVVTAENDISELSDITESNIRYRAKKLYMNSKPSSLEFAIKGDAVLAIYVLKTENVTSVNCGSCRLSKREKYCLEHYDVFVVFDDSGLWISAGSSLSY